jgi:hypothetical protein
MKKLDNFMLEARKHLLEAQTKTATSNSREDTHLYYDQRADYYQKLQEFAETGKELTRIQNKGINSIGTMKAIYDGQFNFDDD